MSDTPTIRLNKVLRELNISLDRAVDHLKTKGVEIEARPTTKISNEVYQILLDEFQTDMSKKVASQEVGEEQRKEKEALRLKIEQEQEEKRIAREKKSDEIIKAKAELSKPNAVGKIDLEEGKKAKSKKEVEAVEQTKPDSKPEEVTPQSTEESVDQKTDETIEQAAPKAEETKSDTVGETEEKESIKTQYQKLSGIKLTGAKIDLTQFEKKKKQESSSKDKNQDKDNKKRKRKRIVSNNNQGRDQKNQNRRGGKNRPKPAVQKVEPTEEEVQKQVRETLEKLQGKSSKGKGAKYRREKRDLHKKQSELDLEQQEIQSKILKVTEFVTVNELATMMDVSTTQIISACMSLGIMVTLNQRLDAETLVIVAEEFGFEVEFITAEIEESIEVDVDDDPEDLEPRAPIVTVMGHVDHGKTSLLDYIREENVIAGESGGITQHIGAYAVTLESGQKMTFLDTPGHEAFTAMRARGAQVTDIVIIVIAADDDIMPQTKEAIAHAQAADVPVVFAINKIDRPTANPDKIKEGLAQMNLLVEDWGGKIQSHDISAKTGEGVNELLEKVLLESELLELKANYERDALGSVVEAFLDKGRGYVSTVLVQNGNLKIGDYVLAGTCSGKVRAMQDERGKQIKEAGPATPISILGLDGAPQAGDKFNVIGDEREAKQIAAKRAQLQREQNVRTQRHITLDEIGRRIALGDFQELNIILKGDVDGSVEALTDSFQKLSTEEIQVNIIHKGVGAITESDVLLATASDAIIIGFNVRPMSNARALAEKEEIDIRTYSIIYAAIDDIKSAMEGMLSPEMKEEITGTAEIRETFKISKIGTIAGCMVLTGKIFRNSKVRLIREGVVVFDGELASLKRFKDDVKEVAKGYDCGMQIKNYNDLKLEDTIEAYQEVAVQKKL
ncbi:MAG: translation initiation factor IF-2 [Flavobacteriaceae bacterium]|nr:translation initiation factor IF-2 [Flavobacteriaceae bacterium]